MLADTRRILAERSLYQFMRQAWPVIEPGVDFIDGWHLRVICDHLQAVSEGKIRRLIINIPPRHMKSLTAAVSWPAWEWTREPHRKYLFASYAQTLSIRDSAKCRRVITSPWYQKNWGDRFAFSSDTNQKQRFENSETGYRLATSVGAALTGEGGNRICIDDPLNAVDASSIAMRNAANEWFDTSMTTRLNDPKRDAMVVIAQRLHEDDLVGHLLSGEGKDEWEILCLPAEFDPEHPIKSRTSLGFVDPRTEKGELLWPERFGRAEIDSLKMALRSYGAAAQLQQLPAPIGGGLFKRQWFKPYTVDDIYYRLGEKSIRKDICWKFITGDLAIGTKEQNDFTLLCEWAVTPTNDLIWLNSHHMKEDAPVVRQILLDKWKTGQFKYIAIEKAQHGTMMMQDLRIGGVLCKELIPDKDKVTRSVPAQVAAEKGQVWVPNDAQWLANAMHELCTFPAAKHDEYPDNLAYAVMELNLRQSSQTSGPLKLNIPGSGRMF